MKIAYANCPAGASGDMLLGALVDAGAPLEAIRDGLAALPIAGYELRAGRVFKHALAATQVEVAVQDTAEERHLEEILAIVRQSRLPAAIIDRACAIFQRIASAEAHIHGQEVARVHLHELGGQDTIIDVVGVLLGLDLLGVEKLYASPLPLGRGFVQSAHGNLPLPAPATLALLEGVPVVGSEIDRELVTPTGAALLVHLAQAFGPLPSMRLSKTGYGAGKRDLPIPNVLCLMLGEAGEAPPYRQEKLVCLACNIDNMNPEFYAYVSDRLFAAGALDVSFTPTYMKKNRPGTLLSALSAEGGEGALLDILFSETTTLGVRRAVVERYALEREIVRVDTPYGAVDVKVARRPGGACACAPEYEDCRRLAAEHGVPLRRVYRAAERAAEARFTDETGDGRD